jgi:hypothetical protein
MYAQPGEYYVEVRDVSPDAFPRHYYPGVLNPEDAARVTLRAGSDLTGIDIRIRDTDLFRVRFSLDPPMLPGLAEHPSAYLPEGASLIGAIIRPLGPGRIAMGRLPYALSLEQIDDDTWMFGQLLGAGDYNVSLGYSSALFGAFRQREFDPDLQRSLEGHARIVNTRITVDADEADETGNVDLGTIPVSPRVSAEGRVVVRPLGRGSIDLTSLRLMIGLTRVRADGTFLLQDRLPGPYGFRFAPDSIPEGWYVESAWSGGRDVLREGLELTGRPAPIQVVIAEGAGRIEGTVRNADGELLPGARVVLILPSHRRGSLLRFPTATADAAGRYVLDGIPPGEYRLLALDEAGTVVPTPSVLAPDLYWESPDFLRRNELRGERITLDPGARLSIHREAILLDDP